MASGGKNKEEKGYNAATQQAVTEFKAVNPLQARFDKQAARWFDYEDGTGEYAGKARDVTTAPGISDFMDIYGSAERLQDEQRYGGGATRLSDINSNYQAQLDKQKDFQLYDEKARGVSNALLGLKEQNYGIAGQSIDADYAKKLAVAGIETGRENAYYNRPRKPSFWDSFKTSLGAGLGQTLSGNSPRR